MFYTYNQNNSGGRFHINERVSEYVIIEAYSSTHADSLAESIGIYFDGVRMNRDCECCGDRWYPAYEGTETPKIYGKDPVERKPFDADQKFYCYVYYLDGTVKSY